MPTPPDPPVAPSTTPGSTGPVAATTAACPYATGAYKFKSTVSPETKASLEKFSKDPPEVGGTAKTLGPELIKLKEDAFKTKMEKDAADGKCTRVEKELASPKGGKQKMAKYEYPDGTMVRYKPDGDAFSGGKATYCVDVKNDPTKPDEKPNDVGFKVDENGKAVPKNPADLQEDGADPVAKADHANKAMRAGHISLEK